MKRKPRARAVLTPEEAAHYCGMTPPQFWAHVKAGEVAFVNLAMTPGRPRTGPRRAGFLKETLDEFLKSRELTFPKNVAGDPEPRSIPIAEARPPRKGKDPAPAKPAPVERIRTWS